MGPGHGEILRGSLSPSLVAQSWCAAESSGRCACICHAILQAYKESQLLLINACALCNCLLFHDQWQPGRIGFSLSLAWLLGGTKPFYIVLDTVILDLIRIKSEKKKIKQGLQAILWMNPVIGGKLMWVIHRNLSWWILGMWRG